MQTKEEPVTPPKSKCAKPGKEGNGKKLSPDGYGRMLSPLKKFSSLRLVSPVDIDQEQNDLEVASVLAEGSSRDSFSVSPVKGRRHETPVRPTTVMTNLQRGNVLTITPICPNSTLHQMAAQGELMMLKQELSEGGVDIDKADDGGLTAFHWACAHGQLPTVEFMVQNGVDINVIGHHGENGLLFASCNGFTDIVKFLLKHGADVNYSDETGTTALMYAAYNSHPASVKILLEFGADMTLENVDHYTAMDIAVGQGHKTVQQVIERHMLSMFEGVT
ncbi:hypothetical protein CHS0354_027909 [Potamilus streckersoni]|uniref:Ankyrin repeat family A protein 2 n=1 Tax=Potamilus streckersoni TaxID=2493646 RepID=A0AAE0W6B9_9BIVA|nr:hypothetical protein CHS0354_027909 [Potamilus streckersoni]